ncbi:MAG TPA: MFS transporter [Candidatus Lokiarchaeia archaeon]|nr:MFS transporter [Candidatus Lokiarchaeia archaeon]
MDTQTGAQPAPEIPSEPDAPAKQNTMKISIAEGSFAQVQQGVSDNYVVPYALALNASTFEVGILSSLSGLLSPLGQIWGSHLMASRSRRGVAVAGALFQAITWGAIISLAVFYENALLVPILPLLLIAAYALYIIIGAVSSPPWFSLMGDIVPPDMRGRYFAKRNIVLNIIGIAVVLGLSFLLQFITNSGLVFIGFTAIFLLAATSRFISSWLLMRHYYPPFKIEKTEYVTLGAFFKEIPRSNFGAFVILVAAVNFGQMIAGPFFNVYMLTALGFDYVTYIIFNLTQSIVAVIVYPVLGTFSDKFGNVRMLKIAAVILPILPWFWIFFTTPLALIFGPQLLSGLAWTAFNLAASNFIYDAIPSHKRGFYVAYYNFLIGVGILLGGLTGSFIMLVTPSDQWNNFHLVFLVSGIVRAVVVAAILPKIKEVRKLSVEKPVSQFHGSKITRDIFTLGLESLWKKHTRKKNYAGKPEDT